MRDNDKPVPRPSVTQAGWCGWVRQLYGEARFRRRLIHSFLPMLSYTACAHAVEISRQTYNAYSYLSSSYPYNHVLRLTLGRSKPKKNPQPRIRILFGLEPLFPPTVMRALLIPKMP